MDILLANQLNKFWLKTDIYKPDKSLQIKIMSRLHDLLIDYTSFIFGLEFLDTLPSFAEVFMTDKYSDYLKLIKKELKNILQEVTTTEQLTGIFLGLLGHEMTFGEQIDYNTLPVSKKEIIMLHNLKLLDMAYQELFHDHIPLPEDYISWINENSFEWEYNVQELN